MEETLESLKNSLNPDDSDDDDEDSCYGHHHDLCDVDDFVRLRLLQSLVRFLVSDDTDLIDVGSLLPPKHTSSGHPFRV